MLRGEASIIIKRLQPTPPAFARASLRLLARLTASVDMTSDVKGWERLF